MFFQSVGLPTDTPVTVIGPNDQNNPGGEANLDIQYIMSVAPGMSKQQPNNQQQQQHIHLTGTNTYKTFRISYDILVYCSQLHNRDRWHSILGITNGQHNQSYGGKLPHIIYTNDFTVSFPLHSL